MKKVLSLLMVGLFILLGTGCTGTFEMTKKVNSWHRGMDSKWADEGLFLGCVIIPVYGLTTLGDAFIFNTLEFWGEENPMADVQGPKGDELCLKDNVKQM
jgi:hypothetical protein